VDAYSFQRYGYLKGAVKSISPDAINDDKQGLVYKMKVEIESSETSKQNTIQIEPGMTVTAEITTGERLIIEFFLDPLMTHTDTSLKVR
jgi:hemolysin D